MTEAHTEKRLKQIADAAKRMMEHRTVEQCQSEADFIRRLVDDALAAVSRADQGGGE